jgi:multiple sugar transport system permease protein
MKTTTRENMTAFWFLFPFLLTLAIFFVYAFVRSVMFSFTNYNLFQKNDFVGIQNFIDVPRDSLFLTALANTFISSISIVLIQTVGALLLAVVLNQKLRGIAFFRTAYYFPSIASSAVTALIFMWLFRPTGLISFIGAQFSNYAAFLLAFVLITVVAQAIQVIFERSRGLPATTFDPALLLVSLVVAIIGANVLAAVGLLKIGNLDPQPLIWLSSRDQFLGFVPYPLLVIIIMNSFTTIPTLMLTFLAGLQGISQSIYEAADIDGANPYQRMMFVTVPMLRPVTFYVITVGVIGTLQMFDQAALFDGTSPLESTVTLAYYVYTNVFRGGAEPQVGLASAAALILAVITLVVVQIQRKFFVSDEGAGR